MPPRISRVRIMPAGLWGVGTCGPGLCSKDRAAAGFSSVLVTVSSLASGQLPLPACPSTPAFPPSKSFSKD